MLEAVLHYMGLVKMTEEYVTHIEVDCQTKKVTVRKQLKSEWMASQPPEPVYKTPSKYIDEAIEALQNRDFILAKEKLKKALGQLPREVI